MRDWMSNPVWGPIGVFLGIFSLFPPAPTLIKIFVFIVISAASIYAFLGRRRKSATSRFTQGQGMDGLSSSDESNRSPSPTREVGNPPHIAPPVVSPETYTSVPIEYTWKDMLLRFIAIAIMFGLPGVLLVRSGVAWQHIMGIVLLIILGGMAIVNVAIRVIYPSSYREYISNE